VKGLNLRQTVFGDGGLGWEVIDFPMQHDCSVSLMGAADSGGSNGYKRRLWKTELQKLATFMGVNITVCHFPPGTSKWNKIEHRLFSFITQNWRGKPLYDLVTVVSRISNTTTSQGLLVKSAVDTKVYPKGIEVTDDELAIVKLKPHDFHGEWNYTVKK